MSNILQHFGSPMIQQGMQSTLSTFKLGGEVDESERQKDMQKIQNLRKDYRECLTKKAMCDATDKYAQSCVYKQQAIDCKNKINKHIQEYKEKYGRTESADWMMFAKGGRVDAQNEMVEIAKENLGQSFALPIEISVYVPSTKGADQLISQDEFNDRIRETEQYLSELFGGYSKVDIDGGYVSQEKGLIKEEVAKVVAFSQDEDFLTNKLPRLVKRIVLWCGEWTQESIGFELEGDLFYIDKNFEYKTRKFASGGRTEKYYSIYDDEGDLYQFHLTANEVIDDANTIFYYDMLDADEEPINTLDDAIDGFESMGYEVREEKSLQTILGEDDDDDEEYAKGGLTAHGLAMYDEIVSGDKIGKTTIRVHNRNKGDFKVDLDKGIRTELAYDKKLRKYVEKKADGGEAEEGVDLFEDYDNIPPKVERILNKYSTGFEDGNYEDLKKALKELEEIGYTFRYDLDGVAYDLRPFGTKGKRSNWKSGANFGDGGEFAGGGKIPSVTHNDLMGKEFTFQGGKFLIVDFPNKQGAWKKGQTWRKSAKHQTFVIKIDDVKTDLDKSLFFEFVKPYYVYDDFWLQFVGKPSRNIDGNSTKMKDLLLFEISERNEKMSNGGSVSKNLKRVIRKGKKYTNLAVAKTKPKLKKIVRKAKIGFDALAKRVAKSYEGKAVAPKYQSEYGKRYSKSEAQEVGKKVAAKVKQMKGM